MWIKRNVWAFVLGAALAAGCGGTPPASSAATPASPPPAPAAPEPATLADIFPAGQAREAVLNNCASCHNAACAAIGQRPAARWLALKASHADRVPGVDLDMVFAYLQEHFNDSRPEPKVPPNLLEGGCTPF